MFNSTAPHFEEGPSLVPIAVPGSSLPLQTDGKRLTALRPIVEFFGLDYSGQLQKLKAKSWATVENISTVGADGKTRDMTGIDRRTLGMWLATLDEKRVAEAKRPDLCAYQEEAADALDAYFHKGGAINPRATEDQIDKVISEARLKIELLHAAKGLISPDHLEARARVVLARGLGEHAELDPARTPLYAQDFLKSKNLPAERIKSVQSVFGKRVKAEYMAQYSREPQTYPLNLANGQVRMVKAYTEQDRPLMERVWSQYYSPDVPL